MRARRAWLGLAWAAAGWTTLLHGLGAIGLTGPDEPRYAAIAAEMAAGHDYITPRLWGQVWLEKPPLLYWMAALSQRIGGVGDAWARLPVALLALVAAGLLGLFVARVHSPRAGWLVAFFGVTAVFWIGFARAVSTDMPLTATLALAMMGLFLWLRERRPGWLWAASAALGLAVLAKGPVALLLVAVTLALYLSIENQWSRLRAVGDLVLAVVVFLAVAAPWYIAVSLRNPEFPREFFLQQNLQRFATNRYQHPQPFWFYLPVILLAALPWTAWLWFPLRRWLRARARPRPLTLYLLLWAAVPIIFFSLSQSKLPGYILPALPPVVALAAMAAADLRRRAGLVASTAGVVAAAATVALLVSPLFSTRLNDRLSARPLARQLSSECGLPFPGLADRAAPPAMLTCQSRPIYQWNLNRNATYGLGYYLYGILPDWNNAAAAPARVLVNAGAEAAFANATRRHTRVVATGNGWTEIELQ